VGCRADDDDDVSVARKHDFHTFAAKNIKSRGQHSQGVPRW
jgi:hypothetical protein